MKNPTKLYTNGFSFLNQDKQFLGTTEDINATEEIVRRYNEHNELKLQIIQIERAADKRFKEQDRFIKARVRELNASLDGGVKQAKKIMRLEAKIEKMGKKA